MSVVARAVSGDRRALRFSTKSSHELSGIQAGISGCISLFLLGVVTSLKALSSSSVSARARTGTFSLQICFSSVTSTVTTSSPERFALQSLTLSLVASLSRCSRYMRLLISAPDSIREATPFVTSAVTQRFVSLRSPPIENAISSSDQAMPCVASTPFTSASNIRQRMRNHTPTSAWVQRRRSGSRATSPQ